MASDDMALVGTIDEMSSSERVLLAAVFDAMTGFAHARTIGRWAKWWSWYVHRALGDRPESLQPDGLPASELSPVERNALWRELVQIAADHPHRPGLATFAIRLAAQLLALDVERADQRASLEAYIADLRRKRPLGTPGDTSGLPRWSEL